MSWDCIVVGGGVAGLSAALVLGRARRSTLVVDAGSPSNLPTHGIGGLLGHDGRPPAELYAMGRDELAKYPTVEVRTGTVADGERTDDGFVLTLADGTSERAARVVLATGMDYRAPDLPGMAELWGNAVFHCPFCHGWEVRDQPLAVLDSGATGAHRAVMLKNWSDDVVLLTNGPATLEQADLDLVRSAGIPIEERRIRRLVAKDGELEAIEFDDGELLPRKGVLTESQLHQRSDLAARLGAETAEAGPVVVDPVAVDGMHTTAVPGLFAVGDLTTVMPQITAAIAAGSAAGAAVVRTLLFDL